MNKLKIVICAGLILAVSPAFAIVSMSLPEVDAPGRSFEEQKALNDQVFATIDVNHNHKLSLSEWVQYYEAELKRMDTNGDGRISRAEIEQASQ